MRWPEQETQHQPSGWKWWQTCPRAAATRAKHLQEQFPCKKWFRRLPAIKKSFGKKIIKKKKSFWKVSPNGKCRSSSGGPGFSGGAAGVWLELGELCRGILASKQLLENNWEHLKEAQGHCRHLQRRRQRVRAGLGRGAGLAAPQHSQCGAGLGWAHPAPALCWSCRTSPASAEGHPQDLYPYICLGHIPWN